MKRAMTGKQLSEEHKLKISNTLMGHSVSDETRKKLSDFNTGKKQSLETIAKRQATRIANQLAKLQNNMIQGSDS